ncbi:MAG: ribonuclease Z [Planctomycetes bacterium]|nr:ribonuclease Z [Planctomycetota bacterium]
MQITFLGTSAGVPTRTRNVTSQAVAFDHGGVWLLDCGEATQHQLMRAGIKPARIERILLTHLHGDHCYGIPGALATMAINGRSEPVSIIGPVGVKELIETVLRISDTALSFPLEITELDGPRSLPRLEGWQVSAHELPHRVRCFGYCLQEAERPGRFHPDRAQALGVAPGRQFGQLQRGEAIQLADGRTVRPEQVADPRRPGRKLVLLGDTCDGTGLAEAGSDCDLLVCETTYDAAREDKARQWGHSTTRMTGELARRLRARTLIITHFSSRYTDEEPDEPSVEALVAEAALACPGTTVLAARDLWSHSIPPRDA